MVYGEFGAAVAAITNTESGSRWKARPSPEGSEMWQSHAFLEKSSYACFCPEGPVPMDTGWHLALSKQQSNSSACAIGHAQDAAE